MASSNNAGPSSAGGVPYRGYNEPIPPPTPGAGPQAGAANLNNIVIEYLSKRGYSRTEAMLRVESAHVDPESGRPVQVDTDKSVEYDKAYALLKSWIENSLDLYKPELRRLLFPIYVHIYLQLVKKGNIEGAKRFAVKYVSDHEVTHAYDLQALSHITLPIHVEENELAKLFRSQKYRVKLTTTTYQLMLNYMTEMERAGGQAVLQIINDRIHIEKIERPPMLGIIRDETVMGEDEGIAGHNSGGPEGNNRTQTKVKLGLLPMDKDMAADVEEELAAEDARDKEAGKEGTTLVEEFQQRIKREESEDSPMRDDVPLPPYKGPDIDAEVANVRAYRDRFRLTSAALQPIIPSAQPQEGAPPGLSAALPSCVMYTFHNTHNGLNTLSFSSDSTLAAGGFSESYVRIWSLTGSTLPSANPSDPLNDTPTTTRRYIGHSGPVYATSFSPDSAFLLSSSEDTSVRLWSLNTHTALVAYRGHNAPVWDVSFGPFGYYFATASHDHTARLWSTEHISPLRIFAGHLSDVDVVAWHPNGSYVVTGSGDKTVRMWDLLQGSSVRVFIGHTSPVTCLAVSPNGKYIASGGDDGLILLWDINTGKRIKAMRGHGKTAVYSLTWSVEGQVLVSGGADNTVRVWAIGEEKMGVNGGGGGGAEMVINGIGGMGPNDASSKADVVNGAMGGLGRGRMKGGKEVVATPDHLAVYYTKKTPVYKVQFTKKNLVLAGGAFTS